ncbi:MULTISPECIES: winged helix-turn-helix domain-containing protein [unclassified Pseudoalteromonas]|uniref:winged helix-turn-helix domain-containing protein n=1 Tax=unclassified Pseudoalteromonas TaxID=194690 RepID=UPI0005A6D413|nr:MULTISPECIES: winged helix-turn-helix domain-containing protein [unclassified Pseudoalteromonas]
MAFISESEIDFSKKIKEVKFGHWVLTPKHQIIFDGQIQRELEPLLYSMLIYFIRNNDRIVTRQELINDVWKQAYVDDNAINRAMSELRKALKSELQRGLVLKTHYRKGYSFLLDIEFIYLEENIANIEQEKTFKTPSNNHNAKKRKFMFGFSFIVAALFLFYVLYITIQANFFNPTLDKIEKPIEVKEEVLSWDQGTSLKPKISNDKSLIAYSFKQDDTNSFNLYIKNTHSLKQYILVESEDDIYPIGWSNINTLYYQKVNSKANPKCEIWQASSLNNISATKHKKLFNCNSDEILSGSGFDNGNKLIYTKYNYRDIADVSVIVSRDLSSGSEFQVSSPNNEERGDFFINISHQQDKIVFLRAQSMGTEIYIANIDGSHQNRIAKLDYVVNSVNWDPSDTTITWLNRANKTIINFDLETNQQNERKIKTQYSLQFSEIVSDEEILLATSLADFNLLTTNISDENPQIASFSNTNLKERLIAPFNLSKESVFIVESEYQSIWLYQAGVRKKLKDLDLSYITSIAISPDDTQLLIALQKQIIVIDLASLKTLYSINLEGVIKKATWPLNSKILLSYAESLQTNPWFYDLEQKKLIKLSNTHMNSVFYVNNSIMFFNEEFELIQQNINTGSEQVLMKLENVSKVVWCVDDENIYYKMGNKIFKKPLKQELKATEYVELNESILNIQIVNTKYHKALYLNTVSLKDNFIVSLKLKPES